MSKDIGLRAAVCPHIRICYLYIAVKIYIYMCQKRPVYMCMSKETCRYVCQKRLTCMNQHFLMYWTKGCCKSTYTHTLLVDVTHILLLLVDVTHILSCNKDQSVQKEICIYVKRACIYGCQKRLTCMSQHFLMYWTKGCCKSTHTRIWYSYIVVQKRHTFVKRGLYVCQKTPAYMSVKRDLHVWS